MGIHCPRWGATYLQDILPDRQGDRGTAPSRGVWDGWRRGRRSGFISSTGMPGIPSSFWRRETPPTHGVPDAKFWCPGVHRTGGTFPPPSASRGQRVNTDCWQRRSFGRVWRGPFRPTENRWKQSPRSSICYRF